MKKTTTFVALSLVGIAVALPIFAALSKPPKDRIALDQAEAAAKRAYQGKIEGHELEKENGQWVYSFDIRGEDARIHEVIVDAKTGNIVSHTNDASDDESGETKEDEKKESR